MKFVNAWRCNECDREIGSVENHAKSYSRHTYTQILRPEGRRSINKEFYTTSDLDESFTTSSEFKTKLRMLRGSNLQDGKYRVSWFCEYYQADKKEQTKIRFYCDDSIESEIISVVASKTWQPTSGFIFIDLEGSDKSFELKWATTAENKQNASAGIRRATFEFRRIS